MSFRAFPGGVSGITGGPGNDILDGGSASDLLFGDEGTDTLNGNAGPDDLAEGRTAASTDVLDADTFNGGLGGDRVRYTRSTQSVSVDLDGVDDDGRPTEGDSLNDIENIEGGGAPDLLIGDDGHNALIGLGGNDSLVGRVGFDGFQGGPGDDVLYEGSGAADTDALDGDTFEGGDGVDTTSYGSATAQVLVTLDDVDNDGSPTERDNVHADVENVLGGRGDDVLTGDGDANRLVGGAGPDTIDGAAGPDTLRGGTGFDLLNGGTDTDDCDVGGVGVDGGSEFNCER